MAREISAESLVALPRLSIDSGLALWQALRAGAISDATFAERVATWVAFTAKARARDQVRWPTVGMQIFPNCFAPPTYEEEVAAGAGECPPTSIYIPTHQVIG